MNITWCLIAVWAGIAGLAHSQEIRDELGARNIILPQRRVILPADRTVRQPVTMEKVNARILVNGRSAVTTLELDVRNNGSSPAEAELLLPVPEGVVVKGFYYGDGKAEWKASLMPADEARRLYDRIVARRKDPALLEFAGFGAIRSSVFPVPPRSSVKLGIVYEQLLTPVEGRLDYVLPRTEVLSGDAPWTVRVELASGKDGPGNLFTPSHQMERHQLENGTVVLTLAEERMNPGPFRLSWLEARGKKGEASSGPEASVYASPDASGGKNGYFLAMVGKDVRPGEHSILREVTLVLDRSGSMRGNKLASVKEAAKQIVSGLNPGERFNIITYNEGVNLFEAAPVEKNGASEKAAHAWLDAVVARGGTNMHEALAAALSQPSHEGMLPVVLFLTDGPSHDRPHFGKIHCGPGGGRKQGGKAHFHHRGGGGRQRPPAEAHGGDFRGATVLHPFRGESGGQALAGIPAVIRPRLPEGALYRLLPGRQGTAGKGAGRHTLRGSSGHLFRQSRRSGREVHRDGTFPD